MVDRAAASFLSAVENTLDALDGVDVVKAVVKRTVPGLPGPLRVFELSGSRPISLTSE